MRRTITLGLAAVFVAAGCTDDGVPDLDTAPALVSFESLVADNTERAVADAGPDDNAYAVLAQCPIADAQTIVEASFDLIDTPGLTAALNQESAGIVTVRSSLDQPDLECSQGVDPEVGIYVTPAPDDLVAYAARRVFQEPELDESRLFRGGRFHRICAARNGPMVQDVCEVVWIDANLLIGVFLRQPFADDVDVNRIEERFQYVLPTIVDQLTE